MSEIKLSLAAVSASIVVGRFLHPAPSFTGANNGRSRSANSESGTKYPQHQKSRPHLKI